MLPIYRVPGPYGIGLISGVVYWLLQKASFAPTTRGPTGTNDDAGVAAMTPESADGSGIPVRIGEIRIIRKGKRRRARRSGPEPVETRAVWLVPTHQRKLAKWEGRVRRLPLVGTVIHTTRGHSWKGAVKKVQEGGPSWHFTIGRDGEIFQHVPLNKTSLDHAGKAELTTPDGTILTGDAVSARTVGIEVVNLGAVVKAGKDGRGRQLWRVYIPPKPPKPAMFAEGDPFRMDPAPEQDETLKTVSVDSKEYPVWWQPFPRAQVDALKSLFDAMKEAGWEEATQYLVGHEDVARPVGRKIDPGPRFPWHEFPTGS